MNSNINGSEIRLVLPPVFAYKNMVPTFTYEGKSITVNNILQTSGVTPQKFMNGVDYEVVGDDGIKKTFNVLISYDPSNSTSFTLFEIIPSLNPTIPETRNFKFLNDTLRAEMKNYQGTKVLIPSFEAPNPTVYLNNIKQVSGVSQVDFTQPVVYRIVQGNFQNYIPVKIEW